MSFRFQLLHWLTVVSEILHGYWYWFSTKQRCIPIQDWFRLYSTWRAIHRIAPTPLLASLTPKGRIVDAFGIGLPTKQVYAKLKYPRSSNPWMHLSARSHIWILYGWASS